MRSSISGCKKESHEARSIANPGCLDVLTDLIMLKSTQARQRANNPVRLNDIGRINGVRLLGPWPDFADNPGTFENLGPLEL